MATKVEFNKKTLAVITGASQGIGQTIAVEVARKLKDGSFIILIARSVEGLTETKKLILEVNDKMSVGIFPLDLAQSDSKDYEKIINQGLNCIENGNVELGVIFHNAGQVGVLNEAVELTDMQEWRRYYELNLFSVVNLNSMFIKKVRDKVNQLVVVNVSSLCGRQPFKNMAMYGSGKAARELFFKVLAVEEVNISVLNYSPGPVDTAMVGEVISNMKNSEMKAMFVGMKENKTILVPIQTVSKLLNILSEGKFKSGDVIDYYDEV